MSTSMQLSELRTAIRQRADQENSQFISDTELNSYINQSYFELYDLLVQKYGDNYKVADPYLITTDGLTSQFPLPATFYKLLGVDLMINGLGQPGITLSPFNFKERNQYANSIATCNIRYRLNGSKLWLTPVPSSGLMIQVWFIPTLTTLALDTDAIDGISGWTEYVIIDAAIKCMQKEESDVSVLMTQKRAMIERIEQAAENRDAGSPATVSDCYQPISPDGWIFV